jgi:hypothetical protein
VEVRHDEQAAVVAGRADAQCSPSLGFALGHKLFVARARTGQSARKLRDYFDAIAQSVAAHRRDQSMEFYLRQACSIASVAVADTFSFTEPLTAWVERRTRPGATHRWRKLDAEESRVYPALCVYPAFPKYKDKALTSPTPPARLCATMIDGVFAPSPRFI